jgi:hypothetical protein
MQSAEQQLLDAIDEMQALSEAGMSIIFTRTNQAIADLVKKNDKIVVGLQGKILKQLAKDQVESDNHIDRLSTLVLSGLDDQQFSSHMLLTQLAHKGGFTKAGYPLESALLQSEVQAPSLAYLGTLLLALGDLKPFAAQLIEVLREIRDRMPGVPTELRGEAHAKLEPSAVIIDEITETVPQEDVPMGSW